MPFLQVVDLATGKALGGLETGEIWIKTTKIMKGYLGNPEAIKAAVDENGWYHTGICHGNCCILK